MRPKYYDPHPFAQMLPATDDDEYYRIREDISKNGLTVPIVLYQGKILDGRTRYRACVELGIMPKFIQFYGTERQALIHVASHNLYRRHLTPSQRAAVGLEYKDLLVKTGMSNKKARETAAEVADTSETAIRQMETVAKVNPKAVKDIVNGHQTVNAAAKTIRHKHKPLANVIERYNDAYSATERLEHAIGCDLDELGTAAEVRKLMFACEEMQSALRDARQIISGIAKRIQES